MNLETKITIYKFTPQLFTLTPETSTYLQSFSTESLRQDNQVEIYEGNADVIYVPIEPMN